MLAYATLSIFKSPGINDAGHISSILGVESLVLEVPVHPGIFGPPRPPGWWVSTQGHVKSDSVREHVDWLLDTIGRRYSAIERLRGEDYWVCVVFHDTKKPDPDELSTMDAELEQLDITFDFELEREDFP